MKAICCSDEQGAELQRAMNHLMLGRPALSALRFLVPCTRIPDTVVFGASAALAVDSVLSFSWQRSSTSRERMVYQVEALMLMPFVDSSLHRDPRIPDASRTRLSISCEDGVCVGLVPWLSLPFVSLSATVRIGTFASVT